MLDELAWRACKPKSHTGSSENTISSDNLELLLGLVGSPCWLTWLAGLLGLLGSLLSIPLLGWLESFRTAGSTTQCVSVDGVL